MPRRTRALACLVMTLLAACSAARAGITEPSTTSAATATKPTTVPGTPASVAPTVPPATTLPDTTQPATTMPATTMPATTMPATTMPATTMPATTLPATTLPATTLPTTTLPATTLPATTVPAGAVIDPATGRVELRALTAAFPIFARGNAAASITVIRDHTVVFSQASGTTIGGLAVTSRTPLVLASVSKLVTALTVARLAERGWIAVDAPVPWDLLNIPHDPSWDDVTVRELLDHTGGMPNAQASWLNDPGSCAIPLAAALAAPPRATRGTWTYSNGNYCALGLLIEAVTRKPLDAAADTFVFGPLDRSAPGRPGRPHLTTARPALTDGPYALGVARLERLGGAGTWMASTDDIAAMLDAVTPADLRTLKFPGIITDQYGWGHTGTVDGARACAWVMEGGRTVVVAVVAGSRPGSGGQLCNIVEPALASDLGIFAGDPVHLPN